MAAVWNPQANALFLQVLEQPSAEREAFLQQACGADVELAAQVRALVAASDEAGSFLSSPLVDSPPTVEVVAVRPGLQIGPYKLLQQIGEGGFGVVYMAEQSAPVKRRVAIKVIKPGMDTRQVIARFEAERQALAVMDHPNIARVLDAGATESGRPFFVMELVRGTPITAYCDENSLNIRERLELFAAVCQAIQHAHTKGIIHRDIKPSNVLVTRQDGQPVVKVIDFGIAKAMGQQLTDKTLFTDFAQMIGTPLYMSPEQAELSSNDIDTRSDIYSLGVLLYELLTGSTPVSKEQLKQAAFDEIRRIIREDEPQKPSTRISSAEAAPSIAAQRHTEPAKLTRLVRGELDWIVMKALEKDRSRRYETATGFAADVQRYLNDEPVLACPPSAAYRFRKFARRNKGGVAIAGIAMLAVLLALLGLTVSNVLITHEKNLKVAALQQAKTQKGIAEENEAKAKAHERIAIANEKTAKANELLARRRYYAAQMNLAMQAWRAGESPRVLELLEGQRPLPGEEDFRGFEWFYLWRLCYGENHVPVAGHPTAVLTLDFSPDGKTLASGGHDGTTRIWDAFTGKELETIRAPGTEIWSVRYSRDGRWLATSDRYQLLVIWDAKTRQQRHVISGAIGGLAFSPDGKYLAGGVLDAAGVHATLWDLEQGTQHDQVTNAGFPLGFLADGGTLVTMSHQHQPTGKVSWWDLETKQELWSRPAPGMNTATVSPDGTRVAAALWRKQWKVEVWDAATGDSLIELTEPSARSLSFSPDSKLLAVGKEDKTVTIWNLETKTPLAREVHLDHVWGTAFSPDGRRLASATLGGAIKLWDIAPTEEATTLSDAQALALQFAAEGQMLLVGTYGLTKIINVSTGKTVAVLPVGGVKSISADATAVAGWEQGGQATVWDPQSGRETIRVPLDPVNYPGLTLSSDGKQAATFYMWGRNNTVQVWDLATQQARTLKPKSFAFSPLCAQFSPDGKFLAAGFHFHLLTVWDLAGDKIKFEAIQQPFMMNLISVAFSSDSRTLAVGTDVGSVTLWDVNTGRQIAACKGHSLPVRALAFSRDGKTLATASDDHTVRLWDTLTGQERTTLSGHTGPVVHLQFTPDGHTLATASSDGTVKLWRGATDRVALAPRQANTRNESAAPFKLPLGAIELTEEGLREAVRRWPDRADLAHRLGQMLQAADHRLPDAENVLDQAVKHAPEDIGGRLALAEVLRRQQKFAPAAEHLREAIQQHPGQAATHQALGWVLYQDQKFAEAELAFREAAQLNPSFAGSHYGLGRVLVQQGKPAEAEVEYREAIRLGGADPQVHKFLAWALFKQRKLTEAEKAFREAVRVNSDDANSRMGLGFTLAEQKQPAAAEVEYREAIRLNSTEPTVHTKLGLVLIAQQRFTEAEESFRKAIQQDEQDAFAHRGLGKTLLELKRFADAEVALQTALRLEPENKEAAKLLEQAQRGLSPDPAKETSP